MLFSESSSANPRRRNCGTNQNMVMEIVFVSSIKPSLLTVDYGSTCTERTLCYHVGGCCHVGAAALQVNNNFAAPLQRNIEALAEDGSTWETKAMQTWLAF